MQGVLAHTRRQLLYDLLLGTALVSADGALLARPAEAALVQMPAQRLKNRYYLVSAQVQLSVSGCLLAIRSQLLKQSDFKHFNPHSYRTPCQETAG